MLQVLQERQLLHWFYRILKIGSFLLYDSTGSMAGKRKVVAARISEQYPKALYTYCASHVLNLCIVSCCSIPDVRNTMDIAKCVQCFFDNSPKCQLALEVDYGCPPRYWERRKLNSVCKTRLVERHEAFEVFLGLFIPAVCCLENASCDD